MALKSKATVLFLLLCCPLLFTTQSLSLSEHPIYKYGFSALVFIANTIPS